MVYISLTKKYFNWRELWPKLYLKKMGYPKLMLGCMYV